MCYDRLMTIKTPCQENPDLWFSNTLTDIRLAQDICSSCSLKDKCYQTAVDNNEEFGIWGGVLFSPQPKEEPEVKMCRSGEHVWIEGQKTCKECRKITAARYAAKNPREYKPGRVRDRKKNKVGGLCINKHELIGDNVVIRDKDNAVLCKKCISGQKTRDLKASASKPTGSVHWH